jgi:hypothetical protein
VAAFSILRQSGRALQSAFFGIRKRDARSPAFLTQEVITVAMLLIWPVRSVFRRLSRKEPPEGRSKE